MPISLPKSKARVKELKILQGGASPTTIRKNTALAKQACKLDIVTLALHTSLSARTIFKGRIQVSLLVCLDCRPFRASRYIFMRISSRLANSELEWCKMRQLLRRGLWYTSLIAPLSEYFSPTLQSRYNSGRDASLVSLQGPEHRMSLDFDIRFDLKSISSHARRGCCSQPGASLEIDFRSLKGGMSRHKQGLKIDFTCFLVHSPRAT